MALTASSRGAYGEESPEALRRRADVLLDEMMLGGIDTGAAGPYGSDSTTGSGNGNGAAHWPQADEVTLDYDGASHGSGPNGSYSTDAPLGSAALADDPTMQSRTTNSRLISAEERYAQLTGAQTGAESTTQTPPVAQTMAGAEAALLQPNAASGVLKTGNLRTDLPQAEAPAVYAGDYRSAYQNEYAAENFGNSLTAGSGGSAAVRRQSPSLASQMSVGVRAANRSNLLPRNNEIDADTVQQEISELLRAVSTSLPAGNEAVERSRHLLSKAQTLLQSDPTRTAEVDYYLQQVRRIVQRTRQTAQWSSLYHKRLTVYLWAWLLLAGMIVTAVALNTGTVIEFLTQLVDAPEMELIVWQAPVLFAGAFAGALGASLSALFNMQRRSRREHSYFDRKYGLRGLLLPLLGMFFGLLLALVAAVIYILGGVDPALQAWAVAVPAVLALVVGFGQEWMYGARS
jgi:hypothetical protein